MQWRQLLGRGGLLLLLTVGLALLSLVALAQKERDDRFCVACHLHDEKFDRFRAPAVKDLAGAHYHARSSLRCIDCHGGADLPMRFRVWALAGLDTVRFLVGHYQEPERMRLSLRDRECKQCHDPIVTRPPLSVEQEEALQGRGDTFHAISEHRTAKTPCVACHTSHTPGEARFQFIDQKRVLPLCRDCHRELGIEG